MLKLLNLSKKLALDYFREVSKMKKVLKNFKKVADESFLSKLRLPIKMRLKV